MNKDEYEKNVKPQTRYLWKLLENELDKKYFGSRSGLNKEKIELLKIDEDFKKDIKRIRKDLDIPVLKLEEDLYEIPHPKHIDAKSTWLEGQPKQKKEKFSKEMSKVLNTCGLPFYFEGWLEMHILYNFPFSEAPYHRLDYAIAALMENSDDLYKIPPTSQEKRLLKEQFRRIFKINGKPSKDQAERYQYFLRALDRLKNRKRRYRTLTKSLKIERLKSQKEEYYSEKQGGLVKKDRTYRDVVVHQKPNISDDQADKEAATARKRIERLRKRRLNKVKK